MSYITTITAPQRIPETPDSLQRGPSPRKTSLLDRTAMRIGLWLILWSRRAQRLERQQRAARRAAGRHFADVARAQHEQAAVLDAHLWVGRV